MPSSQRKWALFTPRLIKSLCHYEIISVSNQINVISSHKYSENWPVSLISHHPLVGFENNCFQFSVELAPGQEFPCFEVDTDYSGGDINCQNDGSFPTAQSCLDKCRSVPSCIGFTWLGPDFTPSNGCCYKDTITRGSGLAGVVSGTIANCGP